MPLDHAELNAYISQDVVAEFYKIRILRLMSLRLKRDILTRKNPYLFKAKNIGTSEEFIRSALDAFLSSQEETLFGNLLENLAIYICSQVYGGKKAETRAMPSVDLEFVRNNIYYIVGIKSGINWGNADQIARMKSNFKAAKQRLKAQRVNLPIVAVNGCMYGRDSNPYKEDQRDPELSYYKYCGQQFWELISGDADLYVKIISPLDAEAKRLDPEFKDIYYAKINEMTTEFTQEFIVNHRIDWQGLIQYVSQRG